MLVFGASASGLDIAESLAETAGHVYLSYSRPGIKRTKTYNPGPRMTIKPGGIDEIGDTWVRFVGDNEDEQVDIDAIVWCTGYRKTFPFISASTGLSTPEKENVVMGLYKQTICRNYPTLAVFNLSEFNAAFVQSEVQAKYFLQLHKKGIVPSQAEMEKAEEKMTQWMARHGVTARQRHACIGPSFFNFPYLIKVI